MNDRGDVDPNYVRELIAGERTYEEGLADGYRKGIERTLAALEGSPEVTGAYTGSLPRSLKTWIQTVRERMARPAKP